MRDLREVDLLTGEKIPVENPPNCHRCGRLHQVVFELEGDEEEGGRVVLVGSGCGPFLMAGGTFEAEAKRARREAREAAKARRAEKLAGKVDELTALAMAALPERLEARWEQIESRVGRDRAPIDALVADFDGKRLSAWSHSGRAEVEGNRQRMAERLSTLAHQVIEKATETALATLPEKTARGTRWELQSAVRGRLERATFDQGAFEVTLGERSSKEWE